MKLILFIFLSSCFCFHATHANERAKRQLGGYRFPGPRTDNYDEYPKARVVKREPQYEERPEYRSSASGYRSQAAASPSYGTSQSYGYPPNNKKPDQYDSEPTREEKEEKEEEKKPSRLELLLAESKFSCGSKKDGYYADLSVGCQVFHYCVAGVKHSWQCPEQTVFHQVHLNCVPASQDICSQSEKFFVVNDYLHKEMDQRGPNNTVRYHQRFYPEEFLGDAALNQPQSWPPQAAPARQSSYPSRPASSQSSYPSRPASSQSYADDDGYSSSRGSSQPSHQSYPSQSYPSRESEPAPYRAASRPTSPPQYSRSEAAYPAPATYSRPASSYSAGSSSHSAGSSSYPSTSGSSYPSSNPRPATRYSSAPASYSAPSSAYTSSPASYSNSPSSYSNSPSSYSNSPSSYSNSPSSYSSGSGSGYQPLSSRASSAIPSSYQPLSSPPSSYSRPVTSSYKKVVPVTPLPRTLPSYPSYNSLPSKPYGSSSGLYGAGSSGRSMTASFFAPDPGFKSGVIYESDF